MNILLLTASYPPMLNSATRIFAELAKGLRDHGHCVPVLTERPKGYLGDRSVGAARVPELRRPR
jgi:hypothetical protein